MSRVLPDSAVPLEAEQTPIGIQTLVSGVTPITPAQRLTILGRITEDEARLEAAALAQREDTR